MRETAAALSLAAVAFGPASVEAAPAAVSLGGYSKWWISAQWSDADFLAGAAADYNSLDVKGDNEVHATVAKPLDNGLMVGARIELEAGGHTDQATDTIDKSYVWIEGAAGKLELGSDYNAASLLHVAAPEAAGLWNGPPMGMLSGTVVPRPAAVRTMYSGNQTGLDHDDNAEKILYFTPSFGGLTLGLSHTPDALSEDDRSPAQARASTAAGLVYQGTVAGHAVTASAGALVAELDTRTNVTAFSVGGQAVLGMITLGGSLGDDRHEHDGPVAVDDGGRSWDVGVMLEHGPWKTSVNHYRSRVRGSVDNPDDDRITVTQVSAKVTIGAGVALMGAAGHITYEDEGGRPADNNRGYAVTTGMGLWF
ncbi:MAG: porin [Pseudomonadota bacterium]